MKKLTPTSLAAKRVATLFHRKLTTPWAEKEIKSFRKLNGAFDSLEDLELIERYYAAERKKGDKGHHRRDLYTFVNNFYGELDRARTWATQQKQKRPIRVTPDGWSQWLTKNYPAAVVKDFWQVTDDIRREFNEAKK